MTPLKLWLGWVITPIHVGLFAAILLIFHPLQIAASWFGEAAHRWMLERMCLFLIINMRVCGSSVRFRCDHELPNDAPIILVCNHQSMYDIPIQMWYLRKHRPNFISKRELARGSPSVSLGLRLMRSCIIDRKDPAQAISAIEEFGRRGESERFMICLFPEGTRGRDGTPKKFKPGGLEALLRTMPSAVVVPAVIDGCWELLRYRFKPVPFGVPISLTVLPAIHRQGVAVGKMTAMVEARIREELARLRGEKDGARASLPAEQGSEAGKDARVPGESVDSRRA